jgi:hypothetical protein
MMRAVTVFAVCQAAAAFVAPRALPRGGARAASSVASDVERAASEVVIDVDSSSGASSSPIFIDAPTAAAAAFPIAPERLIELSREFLVYKNGLGTNPELLAADFRFEGPVVGPLSKDAFVKAIGGVDFGLAFPDFEAQFYGFHVDPLEGDRVWCARERVPSLEGREA